MSLNCPLLKPSCKRNVMLGEKLPFEKPKCPLTSILPLCPVANSKCPLKSSIPEPPKCLSCSSFPSVQPSCSSIETRAVNKTETCPFSFPSPCSPNPTCPLASLPCPLDPPKCAFAPLCPVDPPTCPLASPPKCPLTVSKKPQCALLPPKCPLEPILCSSKSSQPIDICPLDNSPEITSPCSHIHYLNKGLNKKPLGYPVPPPICQDIARKCPFEPKPMICHEMCPCSDVPELESGPRCPFLPPEPSVCPPTCPLEKQPNCPLVKKPCCMWKPTAPTQCPLSPTTKVCQPSPPSECILKRFDICPSFVTVPGKCQKNKAKPTTMNIECCPFCNENPVVTIVGHTKKRSFHFPSCPLFKPPCQLESLPKDVASCPFYPCPCPLTGIDSCPIKVPPLQVPKGKCQTTKSDELDKKSLNQSCPENLLNSIPETPKCPLSNIRCPVTTPSCPLVDFNCPLANLKCPSPPQPEIIPCPVKGCLKKPSSSNNVNCPANTKKCAMFPEGRGSEEDLGLCDCNYPVAPCMVDMKKSSSSIAPPQYCMKDDCCMGLSDPPINTTVATNNTYYSYVALHPDRESTKYFIDVSNEPPDDIGSMIFGTPKEGLSRHYSVIKFGEGYKQCKTVKDILEKRGPRSDSVSQYSLKDCPMDEMAKRIKMSNKKKKS